MTLNLNYPKILEDGFNPESFINCHDFDTIDDVVERVKIVYTDKNLLKNMLIEPVFVDNKLPEEFNQEILINFLDYVIKY